jgi:hypothetical protein
VKALFVPIFKLHKTRQTNHPSRLSPGSTDISTVQSVSYPSKPHRFPLLQLLTPSIYIDIFPGNLFSVSGITTAITFSLSSSGKPLIEIEMEIVCNKVEAGP